jgi:hypothetical protein
VFPDGGIIDRSRIAGARDARDNDHILNPFPC